MVTASELWSRKRLTCSIDSPASRRSLAAECRKMWTPAGRSPRHLEVPEQIAVEGAAGDTAPTVGTGWPQGLFWLHGGEILAVGCQGLLYGLNAGWGNSRLPCLPPLPR